MLSGKKINNRERNNTTKQLENYINVDTGFLEVDMLVIILVNTHLGNYTMTHPDSLTDA